MNSMLSHEPSLGTVVSSAVECCNHQVSMYSGYISGQNNQLIVEQTKVVLGPGSNRTVSFRTQADAEGPAICISRSLVMEPS